MTRAFTPRIDPVTKWVRSLPGRYYRLSEAAQQLGVSPRTLRRLLRSSPDYGPSKIGKIGNVEVYLYTRADIERIRTYFEQSKQVVDFTGAKRSVGRPRKWTKEQLRERQRLYAKRAWWVKKAATLQDAGGPGLSAALEVVSEVEKTLNDMEPAA